MTCEVAVMNKRGVALAADSAVTLGERKVYHTAEKLFELSTAAPIGIMTYGSADMMGVPRETVIKMFTRKLGEQRFDHVEQYAQELLRFIEVSDALFPESAQRRWFRSLVGSYWKNQVADRLQEKLAQPPKAGQKRANTILSDLIDEDTEIWQEYKPIDSLGSAYGERILAEYAAEIDQVEKELFGSFDPPVLVKERLRNIVGLMYSRQWFHPQDFSGIVVAGLGESEAFPVLIHYHVGTVAAGRLRYIKVGEALMTQDDDAAVIPFAQAHMINMFYEGIFPELKERIPEIIVRCVDAAADTKAIASNTKFAEKLKKEFDEAFGEELQEKYTAPLIAAVSALPRYELAKLAEALVNLTAFRARMSATEDETVGGPIDVAVISKGDGFVWVKKKDLVGGNLLHT
jgi:hypothetical protein